MSTETQQVTSTFTRVRERYDQLEGALFLSPLLILYGTFIVGSILFVFVTSFFSYSFVQPLLEAEFVGLDNYARLLSDETFHLAVMNVALFTVTVLVAQILLGLILAVLIHRAKRFTNLYRFSIFAPVTVSIVATGILWRWMYSPASAGVLNELLVSLGVLAQPYGFLTSRELAIFFIGLMSVWKWTGFTMVIYLAGLREIPHQLYEAAEIDGASSLRQFVHITIPQLKSQHLINITLTVVGGLKVFAWVFVTTGGGPGNATEVVGTQIYRHAFGFSSVGYASAMATVLLLGIGIVAGLLLGRR